MSKVTIPKREYYDLIEAKLRYNYLRRIMEKDIFNPPPTRDSKKILKEFATTKKYSKKFLKDLEDGLKHSSFFK